MHTHRFTTSMPHSKMPSKPNRNVWLCGSVWWFLWRWAVSGHFLWAPIKSMKCVLCATRNAKNCVRPMTSSPRQNGEHEAMRREKSQTWLRRMAHTVQITPVTRYDRFNEIDLEHVTHGRHSSRAQARPHQFRALQAQIWMKFAGSYDARNRVSEILRCSTVKWICGWMCAREILEKNKPKGKSFKQHHSGNNKKTTHTHTQ